MNSLFQSVSLPLLIGIFVVAAAVVWIAGTKLSVAANEMAEKTGIGSAFIGILILGGITSIPEIVTTLTASLHNKPNLAASNLIGGISMQVTLLVVADLFVHKHAISSLSSGASIVFQGIGCILLLSFVILGILFPGFSIFSVGIGTLILFVIFLVILKFSYDLGDKRLWERAAEEKLHNENQAEQESNQTVMQFFSSGNGHKLLLSALIIVVAGYIVVTSVEVISEKTGLNTNIAGFVLIAITTSLPEISTVTSSVKIKKYEMVFANIFGTNLFDAALLFPADIAYRDGELFNELGEFAIAGSALGILITAIFLAGLLNIEKKKFFRVGWDSFLAIICYLAGLYFLFGLK